MALDLVLIGLAAVMAVQAVQETRIGRALFFEGEAAQALIVSVEHIERSQCDRSQRSVCWSEDNYIVTVVYQVDEQRSGTEIRLTPDAYSTFEGGGEVFVGLIYLPADPLQVERRRGGRLHSAEQDQRRVYILAAFGRPFIVIGSIALLAIRKRAQSPSTGQGG